MMLTRRNMLIMTMNYGQMNYWSYYKRVAGFVQRTRNRWGRAHCLQVLNLRTHSTDSHWLESGLCLDTCSIDYSLLNRFNCPLPVASHSMPIAFNYLCTMVWWPLSSTVQRYPSLCPIDCIIFSQANIHRCWWDCYSWPQLYAYDSVGHNSCSVALTTTGQICTAIVHL